MYTPTSGNTYRNGTVKANALKWTVGNANATDDDGAPSAVQIIAREMIWRGCRGIELQGTGISSGYPKDDSPTRTSSHTVSRTCKKRADENHSARYSTCWLSGDPCPDDLAFCSAENCNVQKWQVIWERAGARVGPTRCCPRWAHRRSPCLPGPGRRVANERERQGPGLRGDPRSAPAQGLVRRSRQSRTVLLSP